MAGVVGVALCCLATVVAAESDGTAFASTIDRALTARCLNNPQTSVRILSVPDGKPVYERNPDTALMPASIQKIVTTAAALHYLGPEFRFITELRYRGKRQGDTVVGDLILRGSGDPFLNTEDLRQIARQLSSSGIRQVTGQLIADVHIFDEYDRAPAWDEVRTQKLYDAKLGALSLNLNSIAVHMQAGAALNDPLRVWLEPAPAYIYLNNQGRTGKAGKNSLRVQRSTTASNEAQIAVLGNLPVNGGTQVAMLNVDDPTRYSIESFRAFLSEAGVQVQGSTQVSRQKVEGNLLHSHSSPPLSLILKELNTYSNNFIAEQILKTIAARYTGTPATHAAGLGLVTQFLSTQGIAVQALSLLDGSGLSRDNRFSARAMTELLLHMYPRFDVGPDFMASLRVMGAQGVHSKRLINSPARGLVRAKTGTLNRVSTLAGYVPNQQGQLFAFAFFLNNNDCGYRGADDIEDSLIKAIYQLGAPSTAPGTAPVRVQTSQLAPAFTATAPPPVQPAPLAAAPAAAPVDQP